MECVVWRADDATLADSGGVGPGGVSVFALQLAVAAGFAVVATSSRDEKLGR